MDSSTFKYHTTTEDELKTTLPTNNKDPFSRHQGTSLKSRVEKSNSKLKTSYEEDNMFGPSYQNNLMPEYYNLRVNGSTTEHEEGDYITLKEVLPKPPTPPPLPDTNEPPPLPPRNVMRQKTSGPPINKLNTGFNSNPRPNQKVYSAEDINRLLRPLNAQNVNIRRSITSFEPVHPERYPQPVMQPTRYYLCPHVCDCHRYTPARIYHEFSSPPPYNHPHHAYDTEQNITQYRNPIAHPSKNTYSETNPAQTHQAALQKPLESYSHRKYNTIAVDRYNKNHNFYNSPSIVENNSYKYRNHSYLERTTSLQENQNSVLPQGTRKNSNFKEEKVHPMTHKLDPLHQTEVFSEQDVRSDPGYRSLKTQPCYTIPEEGSWLPPFHYDPAAYHSNRRTYHH